MGRSGLHFAAVVMAGVNLLSSVIVCICFFVARGNFVSPDSMGIYQNLTSWTVLQIVSVVNSALFFALILKKRIALTSIYWFAIAVSVVVCLGLHFIFAIIAVCFAVIGMTVLAVGIKPIAAYVSALIYVVVILVLELLVVLSAWKMLGLITVIVPWFPAAPLIPAAATALTVLSEKRKSA